MSERKKKQQGLITRRGLLQGIAGAGAGLATSQALSLPITYQSDVPCSNQYVPFSELAHAYPSYQSLSNSINGHPIRSQGSTGSMAPVAPEHRIQAEFYSAPVYVGNGDIETRHMLIVNVGNNSNTPHPIDDGNFSELNTISDIYIFNNSSGELLYWKQFGGGDPSPSTMFILDETDVSAQRTLKIVARCSMHGYWSEQVTLSSPLSYSSLLPSPNSSEIMAGTSLDLPYSPASRSTDGNQGLGNLHRIRFNIQSGNDQLSMQIGSGHPHQGSHYIMGGAIFDQSGNLLAPIGHILFSQNSTMVGFDRLQLSNRGVKTIRGVIFDSLQGYIMTFIDL